MAKVGYIHTMEYLEIKVMNTDTYYNMDEFKNIEASHKTQSMIPFI